MSTLRILTGLWRSREETSDRAKSSQLRTQYYKERKDRLIEKILHVTNQKLPNWKVIHVDKERGEIMMEKQKGLRGNDIVVSVYDVGPMRSAVDMVCAARGSFGDLGSSYFTILEFFNVLHKEVSPDR